MTDRPSSAGPARRLGAALYDTLLVVAIWMLAYLPVVMLRGGELADSRDPLHLAFRAALAFAFFAWAWTRSGQTLGMQAWRLKVTRRDGAALTLADSARRFAVALIYLAPYAVAVALGAVEHWDRRLVYTLLLGPFLLGILWSKWDRDGLAPHDRLSATQVVRVT